MIERENTRPTLVECCAWFDCFFVHAVGVLFPALFSHPFLRAWQGWSCLLVLVYSLVFLHPPSFLSFFCKPKNEVVTFTFKNYNDHVCLLFTCFSARSLESFWRFRSNERCGTVVWNFTRTTTRKEVFVWKPTQRLFLLPTCTYVWQASSR